ncbi:ankyrin repeat domain-containing protein [Candidatus Dependentiae bacterium]|nr:ankyrin repeat domain-containing protein [Candidatus Dependentiae bacterium]
MSVLYKRGYKTLRHFLWCFVLFLYNQNLYAAHAHNPDYDSDNDSTAEEESVTIWSYDKSTDDLLMNELEKAFSDPKIELIKENLKQKHPQILHYAACLFDGNPELRKICLHPSCDINVVNECNKTALHLAAEYGHYRNFVDLLLYGADYERYDTTFLLPHECCADNKGGRWIKNFMRVVDAQKKRLKAVKSDVTLSDILAILLRENLGNLDKALWHRCTDYIEVRKQEKKIQTSSVAPSIKQPTYVALDARKDDDFDEQRLVLGNPGEEILLNSNKFADPQEEINSIQEGVKKLQPISPQNLHVSKPAPINFSKRVTVLICVVGLIIYYYMNNYQRIT